MWHKIFLFFLLSFSFPCIINLSSLEYQVEIKGDMPDALREYLYESSQLASLSSMPIGTVAALEQRASSDLFNLVSVLRIYGYYDPEITPSFYEREGFVSVEFLIDTGPVFPIQSLTIEIIDKDEDVYVEIGDLLQSEEGNTASASAILDLERILLERIEKKGFPLAKIENREVLVDQDAMGVSVVWRVVLGPPARFGTVHISGLKKTRMEIVLSRLAWGKGDPYDPDLILITQQALERTGFFCSVLIEPGSTLDESGFLPIYISLNEALYRTIATGVSVSTQLGPGFFSSWEHRNIGGCGRKISLNADIWLKKQTGKLQAIVPNERDDTQRYLFELEAEKERTKGFTETFISAFSYYQKEYSRCLNFSCGLGLKRLFTSGTDNNKSALLLKTPLQLKWTTVDSIVNPIAGQILRLSITPSWQVLSNQFVYSTEEITWSTYAPFCNNRFILAFKGRFGTILGGNFWEIPPPERFYAGTPCTLRGYKYMTVSPLNDENKPIGGLSLLVFSQELRANIYKNIGCNLFYEVGGVETSRFPNILKNPYQSWGVGISYDTILGPIRGDVAFPLNRRSIDPPLQFYLSIGQAF